MGKKSIETLVGIFVLLGLVGLVFLALKASNLDSFSGGGSRRTATEQKRASHESQSLSVYIWGDLHGLQPDENGLEKIRFRSHQSGQFRPTDLGPQPW